MAYDAAAVVQALERPVLTVERSRWWHYVFGVRALLGPTKTYTGRVLSHPEWVPIGRRWVDADAKILSDAEAETLLRDTCRAIGFPWRVVRRLPGVAINGLMEDFWRCQILASIPGTALGLAMPSQPSQPGNDSPSGSQTSHRRKEGSSIRA